MSADNRRESHESGKPILWRAASGLGVLALGMLLLDLGTTAQEMGRFSGSLKWRLAGLGGLGMLTATLVLFVLTWTRVWPPLQSRLHRVQAALRRLAWLNLLPPLLFCMGFLSLVYFPPRFIFEDPAMFSGLWARMGLILLVGLVSAPFLSALLPSAGAAQAGALAVMAAGVLYKAAGFVTQVSPSPFTLGWSEASRFYYGSLFQSAAVYGEAFPLPFLHPSRYLLLSLPFLIPGLPIWAHRLWQVLLWLGMTGLAGWLLARRIGMKGAVSRWIAAGWAFLFFFQGPVYYHLLLCVIPLLAWFQPRRFWRSLAVLGAASAWAGISRINWWPMPAFLAVMLYLLETPLPRSPTPHGLLKYSRGPLVWGLVGGAAALAANAAYIALSGQPDPGSFGTSFTSDLLWYRLWPSPTYPPGILPMAVLISLPLWALVLANLRRAGMHVLRLSGLAAVTLVMFAGGLVVSTKIGGGSNLHNLDAYLVLLAVWGGFMTVGRAAPDGSGPAECSAPEITAALSARLRAPWYLILLVLVLPLVPLLLEGGPLRFGSQSDLRDEAAQLRGEVERAASGGGEVLFIWQRQLLTFHEVSGLDLVYEYETVDLMEMAMSNNRPYLEEFYRQLAEGRFALIVAEAQHDVIKGEKDAFPEENNVWVERITRPLLEYYEPLVTYPVTGTQLLVPKP